MELNPFPTAASMLLVSVVALSFSMPAAAYGQTAQTPASDPTSAGKAVFSQGQLRGLPQMARQWRRRLRR